MSGTGLIPSQNGRVAHSAATSSFGGAVAVIFVWFLNSRGVAVPNDTAMAFTVVFSVLASYASRFLPAGGYSE